MNPGSNNGIQTRLAKVLSIILHPVLMPAYVMAVLIFHGLLPYATTQVRIYFTTVVLMNTVLVPGVCMLLFNRLRFWRENPDMDFRRRILPMAVMLVCYGACLVMIRDVAFSFPVKKMLAAGIGCLVFGLATTFFWKVSLHMTAQGAVVAFLGVLVMTGVENILPVLCVSIALAALLASARLRLGVHDALQVAGGFAGGFIITLFTIYLI